MASDNFDDDDTTPLEDHNPNWTSIDGTYVVTNLQINSNILENESTYQRSGAYYSASSEDTCQVDFVGGVASFDRFAGVRGGSGNRGYAVRFSNVTGANFDEIRILKDGVFYQTISTSDYAYASTHEVKIVVSGTTTVSIDIYIDGDNYPANDDSSSPLPSGNPCLWVEEAATVADSRYDNWTDGGGPGVDEIIVAACQQIDLPKPPRVEAIPY